MSTEEVEIWNDVSGFEGLYQVSSLGDIKSLRRDRLMTKSLKDGYHRVCLSDKFSNVIHVSVARFVAQAFIPNNENKPQVNHKNGIKTDNTVENLEWCTHTENIRHGFKTGLYKPRAGESHPRVKLSSADVIKIRSMYPAMTYMKIAAEFGIAFSAVHNIVNRKRWKHIQ